jgi:hypothetical protein
MAIRMDLRYKVPQSLSLPDCHASVVDLDEAISHREVLLMELSNIFRESLISCAWKLEHCIQKGYSYHLLLLFDASSVSDGIATGRAIGELWDDSVTQGAGDHHNYYVDNEIWKCNGLGTISPGQAKAMSLFKERVVSRMVKADYFMQIREGTEDLAFGIEHAGTAKPFSVARASVAVAIDQSQLFREQK